MMTSIQPNQKEDASAQEPSALRKECILAQKVYDRCRIQDCVREGPAVSEENGECVVVHPEIGSGDFGRIIWPGGPVRLPKWVRSVRCVDGSFRIRSIKILSVIPSPLTGYWDISIEFVFDFQLHLFGAQLTPIKILCRPGGNHSTDEKCPKDALACSVSCVRKTTLFGSVDPAPCTASDLLPPQDFCCGLSPHVLVQAEAAPVEFQLAAPEKSPCPRNVPDDPYCEPFRLVFAVIALRADVSLFRFTCLALNARDCRPPRECPDPDGDPCVLFQKIDFPEEQFLP